MIVMKEIRETKEKIVKEEVVKYIAKDGTEFSDMDNCLEYEKSAKCVVQANAKRYLVAMSTEIELYNGSVGYDDNRLEIYDICDSEAAKAVAMYIKYLAYDGCKTHEKVFKYIGNKILVFWNPDCDWAWISTYEDIIKGIRKSYEKILEKGVD